MAHGVFIHRSDSVYDDVPSERYQFPRQYLGRVEECVGDWIIYYEPSKVTNTRGYFAVAKVQEVVPDPSVPDMFLAIIVEDSYLDFGNPVPFRGPHGVVERRVLNADGRISGRAQSAVRPISTEDFARIVELGLLSEDPMLPRVGELSPVVGFQEAQTPFQFQQDRARAEYLGSRIVRDRNFRRVVLRAYDERCAITGLRLINGGGRAEVEAAHIRPVEENGPDLLTNGIALSGTAHWMFDRGLIGVADDLTILVSRQVNDPDAVHSIMNPGGYLIPPKRAADRPHPRFLNWHRENRFKH
jgi:putative restriction endonuclease